MKKCLILVVLVALIALLCGACQPNGDDITVINQPQAEPGPSGVNIFLKTQIAQGEYGDIEIYRTINDTDYKIDLPLDGWTVMHQAEYTFELDPGDYWLSISGNNFDAVANFTVESGKMTDLTVTLNEWRVPTLWFYTNAASPSGAIASGMNVEIFRFNVMHDWDVALSPYDIGFSVMLGGSAQVDNCQLQILTLTGFQTIGGPVSGNCDTQDCSFHYSTFLGNLDSVPINPSSTNVYSLRCDIMGTSGDTMQAYCNSFQMDTGGSGLNFGSWGNGNGLTF